MSYVYIGTLYHKTRVGQLVLMDEDGYVIIDKKIGKTKDVTRRELELTRNSTKDPIGYVMIKAWHTGADTDKVESALHAILDHDNTEGEFFRDDEETLESRVSKFMNKLEYPEHNFETTDSSITLSAKKVIKNSDSKILRNRMAELAGQQFSCSTRDGVEVTIEITELGKFKCVQNQEEFDKPNAAYTSLVGGTGIACYTRLKNVHGRNIDDELSLLPPL